MTLLQAGFLLVAAIVTGALNSVAGGGGLIIFPALLLVGLPSISANATSTLASWPGCVVSLGAYHQELQRQPRLSLLFGSISLIGGMLGAMLLLHTPTATFNRLVPYLLMFSTLVFTFSDSITTRLHLTLGEVGKNSWQLLRSSFILFFIAIYGGFYGLGISFLILATLGMLGMRDIHQMNALKVLMFVCIGSLPLVSFVFAGVVAWPQAVLIMLGTSLGGYSSAYYARQLQPQLLRRFIIAIGWVMTCYFFLHGWS